MQATRRASCSCIQTDRTRAAEDVRPEHVVDLTTTNGRYWARTPPVIDLFHRLGGSLGGHHTYTPEQLRPIDFVVIG
jgi:hypothetical protein